MQPQSSPLLRKFYPGIDGLRAIAILLVFLHHYGAPVSLTWMVRWGWSGVTLFFVISGFLITGILLNAAKNTGYFRTFYTRRSLRIFPLYIAVWLFLLLLTPLLHLEWNRYVVSMAFYFGNFFIPNGILGLHAEAGTIYYPSLFHPGLINGITVNHFWSLCIEEQFYLVWPALLWLVRSRKSLFCLCLVLMVASSAGRCSYAYIHPDATGVLVPYFNTFFRADALLAGAALAIGLRVWKITERQMLFAAATLFVVSLALLLWCAGASVAGHASAAVDPLNNPNVMAFGLSGLTLLSLASLMFAVRTPSLCSLVLQWKPMVALGRVSYGFYVFSSLLLPPYMALVHHASTPVLRWLCLLAAFAVLFLISELSFRFLESPFLSLKERLAPRPGAVSDPPAAGTRLHAERTP